MLQEVALRVKTGCIFMLLVYFAGAVVSSRKLGTIKPAKLRIFTSGFSESELLGPGGILLAS